MSKSRIEYCLCRILDTLGLGGKYLPNQMVNGHEVDVLFPEHRIIMEADGEPYHQGENMRDDRIRDLQFHNDGYKVIRFWGGDILYRPWKVRQKIIVKLWPSPLKSNILMSGEYRMVANLEKKWRNRNA